MSPLHTPAVIRVYCLKDLRTLIVSVPAPLPGIAPPNARTPREYFRLHALTTRMFNALTLSRRTPVYDHAGVLLFIATRDRAAQLIAERKVDILGNRFRIRGLRIPGPDPAGLSGPRIWRRRMLGAPHRHENYWNPEGVWTLDPIPYTLHQDFHAVVWSCAA